ncbi:MAG: hypothetical protein HY909_12635 [Deltaproteobacteria bacterium]|nr:hypothetical protein [Deltaproteobacteria bacterium]
MRTPPLSGPALRALVAAAESPFTGDLLLHFLRKETGIDKMLLAAAEEPPPTDIFPLETRGDREGS